MAHHKAALKSIRQTKKQTLRNRHAKTTMRSAIKKIRALLDGKTPEQAKTLLPQTYSVIDKSVTKGIIHRNTADRYKSRIAAQLNHTVK